MTRFVLTPEAEGDLIDIWSYIARDSIDAANRVEDHIYEACAFVGRNSLVGRIRPEMTQRPVRFWSIPRFPAYILVYDPARVPVSIIRILHGAMDLPRHL